MKMSLTLLAFILIHGIICVSTCSANAGCESIKMVNRAEWNAKPSKPPGLTAMHIPIQHIFIHQTETKGCLTKEACTKMVQSIQHFHQDTRNWTDIGYNFLIGGDGHVYEGRGGDKVGAHTRGMNDKSIAFSLIGNYMSKQPSEEMLNTVKNMIQCAIEKGIVSKNYQVHGHRDQNCTDCPGDALYEIIKSWTNFVHGPLKTFKC